MLPPSTAAEGGGAPFLIIPPSLMSAGSCLHAAIEQPSSCLPRKAEARPQQEAAGGSFAPEQALPQRRAEAKRSWRSRVWGFSSGAFSSCSWQGGQPLLPASYSLSPSFFAGKVLIICCLPWGHICSLPKRTSWAKRRLRRRSKRVKEELSADRGLKASLVPGDNSQSDSVMPGIGNCPPVALFTTSSHLSGADHGRGAWDSPVLHLAVDLLKDTCPLHSLPSRVLPRALSFEHCQKGPKSC